MGIDPNLTRSYPITPDQFSSFRSLLIENDITAPSGNNGTIETHGVKMNFSYDGLILVLIIISKPFFFPASMIWNELEKFIPTS